MLSAATQLKFRIQTPLRFREQCIMTTFLNKRRDLGGDRLRIFKKGGGWNPVTKQFTVEKLSAYLIECPDTYATPITYKPTGDTRVVDGVAVWLRVGTQIHNVIDDKVANYVRPPNSNV